MNDAKLRLAAGSLDLGSQFGERSGGRSRIFRPSIRYFLLMNRRAVTDDYGRLVGRPVEQENIVVLPAGFSYFCG